MSQQNKKINEKKLACQELHNSGWSFIFVPKHDQILGIKTVINYASQLLDDEGKPKINPNDGKLVFGVNIQSIIQYFTKEEYKEQMELTGKPNV